MNLNVPTRFRAVLATLAAAAILPAHGAWYAKFDGIDGSVTAKDHESWCAASDLAFSVRSIPPADPTAGIRSYQTSQVRLGIISDKAMPKLLEAAVKGKVFTKVEIHGTASSENGETVFVAIELENVHVTSYAVSGASDGQLHEGLALNYTRVWVTQIRKDGSRGGNVEFEWKVEEGES